MDFKLFDADNHYYEAEDAFTRYGDERVKRYVRWVSPTASAVTSCSGTA